jgi:hypothetical protein
MKIIFTNFLLLNLSFASFAQPVPTPFSGCPDVTIGIVRAGINADNTNPFNIYNVNPTSGNASLLSGPILKPADGTNLQINAIGLNKIDGFAYGIETGTAINPPFYKIGANAVAQQHGVLVAPTPIVPTENFSFVNGAAGECSNADKYYYTSGAGSINLTVFPPTFTLTSMYISTVNNISTLPAGSSAISATNVKIFTIDPNCSAYYANTTAPIAYTPGITSVSNTGIRDLVFNPKDGFLYSYVTFPSVTTPGQFLGQLIKVNPATGEMTSPQPPTVLPFASNSNEVAGTFLDKNGNLLVLFTTGSMYKAVNSGPGEFTGDIASLNTNTGLSNPLRGDMASCTPDVIVPLKLKDFNAYLQNNDAILNWATANETNTFKILVLRSTDTRTWETIASLNAAGYSVTTTNYSYTDKNINNNYYYKLQFVDADGTVTYSHIKKINIDKSKPTITAYPNPVTNFLIIENNQQFASNTKFKVFDVSGRTLQVQFYKSAPNKFRADVNTIPSGNYIIEVNENSVKKTIQFVKK